jgi:hypothetical protein
MDVTNPPSGRQETVQEREGDNAGWGTLPPEVGSERRKFSPDRNALLFRHSSCHSAIFIS